MKLQSGKSIPSFNVQDLQGETVSSDDLNGSKWMLSFYRYSECMFCNLRIHQLLLNEKKYEAKGFKMVAVFQSPKADLLKSVDKQAPFFPLIPDPERKLYKLYGVEENNPMGYLKAMFKPGKAFKAMNAGFGIKFGHGSSTLIPADFLINSDGTIHTAYYGKDISDHLEISVINEFLKD